MFNIVCVCVYVNIEIWISLSLNNSLLLLSSPLPGSSLLEKCASKNQFKSKLDFQNQQYKAHTHALTHGWLQQHKWESRPSSLHSFTLPPPLLCTFVTHTQSLNMSLEKSFLRRKYFVAACLESSSILARHPKPGLLLCYCWPWRRQKPKAGCKRRLFILYARHTSSQAGKHTKPARPPCLIYAGWILKFHLLLHLLIYLLLRLSALSSASNSNRRVQKPESEANWFASTLTFEIV